MDISKAWGYGAIVLPRKYFWQAFILLDPDDSRFKGKIPEYIEQMGQHLGRLANTVKPEDQEQLGLRGVMASIAVDLMMRHHGEGLSLITAAISKHTGWKYWVIDAEEDERGMKTRIRELEGVSTPEEARDAIDKQVAPLKLALLLQMTGKKP